MKEMAENEEELELIYELEKDDDIEPGGCLYLDEYKDRLQYR